MPLENKIKKHQALKPLTSFKIGGRAEYFLSVSSALELKAALRWARRRGLKVRWFGGGSNLLVKGGFIRGLTIRLEPRQVRASGGKLIGGAGTGLSQFVAAAAARGLSGLEWAAGIPGTVGGAVRGNAGAFGRSISQNVSRVWALDADRLELLIFSRGRCGFGYRQSIFKKNSGLIIYRVELKLKLASVRAVKKLMAERLAYRQANQPQKPSAGSVFKNLSLSRLKKQNPGLAKLAARQGKARAGKVPAGWVIERLGLKGKRLGGAQISLQHANFIINTGRAVFKDVKMLINYVKKQALAKLRIKLEEEIQYFGD